jgi:hypothetical protein
VAAVALWAPWRSSESATAQPLVRLDLTSVKTYRSSPCTHRRSAVSLSPPDGRRLVFEGLLSGGSSRLFVGHMVDATRQNSLARRGRQPFVSPDGQWGVPCRGRISKVPLDGGAVVQLVRYKATAKHPSISGYRAHEAGCGGPKRGLFRSKETSASPSLTYADERQKSPIRGESRGTIRDVAAVVEYACSPSVSRGPGWPQAVVTTRPSQRQEST